MFISLHGFWGEHAARVVEVLEDGSTRAYPNAAWAGAPRGDGPGLVGVLGLNVDREGVLWMLDGQSPERPGRLVAWDTRAEALHAVIELRPPATVDQSFLNDLAVDRAHEAIYVADSAGAVIVVDLHSGRARRVLAGARSTAAEDVDMVIDGRRVQLGGAPARIGINPITIDAGNEWLYYGPMSGTSLYRVRTADLRDATLSPAELEARVELYGEKPLSDGSTVDSAGNVYVTSVTDDSVGVTLANGEYRTLFQSPELSWPDGFAVGPDGLIYVTVNELHRSPVLGGGEGEARGVFKIMRFEPLAPASVGR